MPELHLESLLQAAHAASMPAPVASGVNIRWEVASSPEAALRAAAGRGEGLTAVVTRAGQGHVLADPAGGAVVALLVSWGWTRDAARGSAEPESVQSTYPHATEKTTAGWWQGYSAGQLETAARTVAWILSDRAYAGRRTEDVLSPHGGHPDKAGTAAGAVDPGPGFPWLAFVRRVDVLRGTVTAHVEPANQEAPRIFPVFDPSLWPLPRRSSVSWVRTVLERVSRHEGSYDSVNQNTDGAGASCGILQWSQGSGNLAVLAKAYRDADPAAFARIFGSSADALLSIGKSLAAVDGAVLWKDPWLSRWRAAGKYPAFQLAQRKLAIGGEHFAGALAVARMLDVATVRSLALFFDTSTQQGPTGAKSIASATLSGNPGRDQILSRFCANAVGRHVRSEVGASWKAAGTDTWKEGSRTWKRVDGEYHQFAGSIDLPLDIKRRRFGILNDSKLSDAIVDLNALELD